MLWNRHFLEFRSELLVGRSELLVGRSELLVGRSEVPQWLVRIYSLVNRRGGAPVDEFSMLAL